MDDIFEVENVVKRDCMKMVHLMSNRELTQADLAAFGAPEGTQAKVTQEAGVWHLRAEWPFQGALQLHAEGWPRMKTMVAWSFDGCANMTEAFMRACVFFENVFGQKPEYGFVRKLPSGVENGREVGPLTVFEAEWMLEKAVAVGGRR